MSSSAEEDVMRIRRKLENITEQMKDAGNQGDSGQALDLLRSLNETKMNLQILTKTRIGMTVNALRKSSQDEDVITLAKNLIKAWKKFLPDNSSTSSGNSEKEKKDKRKSEGTGSASNGKNSEKDKKESENSSLKSFPPKASATTDDVRLSCRKMLANALRGDGVEGLDGVVSSPEELAEIIEDKIFEKNKQTNPKYKAQVRSRVFNLKDKKNPSLRENVLCGTIKPEKLAVMTSEEMASDEVKKLREQFIKEGVDASQLAIKQGTLTTQLKCGKCKKNNCTFHEMQTRSADEPMTVFVFCNECGNRWKQ